MERWWIRASLLILLLISLAAPAAATTYYVSATGSDTNSGMSAAEAWRTIARVNAQQFAPGDQILFAGGQTFSGSVYFDAADAGTPSAPIEVASFGSGRATIMPGNSDNGILVWRAAGFHIHDLILAGAGRDLNTKSGIFFYNDLSPNVLLDTVSIDHVDATGFGRYGIELGGWGGNGTNGYKNVRITYAVTNDNGLGGIFTYAQLRAIHRNVYVGHSIAVNNAGFSGLTYNSGNGITMSGVDGGTIEYSVAHDNGWRCDAGNGPIGIWTFSSNNVVIQFNESYNNRTGGTKDGGGYSLDNSTSNSVLQYNYSHGNAGAGYMLAHKDNDYTHTGNVVRWNVSQNDARKNNYAAIQFWGRILNAAVYNNTVYLASGNSVARAIHGRNNTIETQDPQNVRISNNVFQTTGGLALVEFTTSFLDNAVNFRMEGNEYWSTGGAFRILWKGVTYSSLDAFRSATGQERLNGTDVGVSVDPVLRAGGAGPAFGNALMNPGLWQYRLQPSSLLIDAGVDLSQFGITIGARDYFGGTSLFNGKPDIGAHEYSVDCSWSLSPSSASVPATGGSGSISVWAPDSSCGWAALPSASWISVSPGYGAGASTTTFTVAANASSARTGSVRIGDQSFAISEDGASGSSSGGTIGSWSGGDVGSPSLAGSATGDGSSFTVDGSGADIWGSADQFYFVQQQVSGDWDITARVVSIENVNAWTKAGLMIRETLDADAKHASIFVTPGKGISFQYRASTGGTTAAISAGSGAAPQWIRLTRRGTTFTAYVQASTGTWNKVASTSISMANDVYVGLAVTSHDVTQLATAQFDNVSAQAATASPSTPPAAPWSQEDIGAVAYAGSASVSGTTYTLTASGADIWGNADAFHYVQQPLSGDFDLDATVTSVDNVSSWTKAGVMIRETLDAGSTHASIYVTPGKGISFQYRATTDGTSAAAPAIAGTAPQRIRISRRGTTFSGYRQNADGTWTLVGTASITMNTQVYLGLALTSHDNTRTASASFDAVTVTAY